MLDSKKKVYGTDGAKLCQLSELNWYVIYTKPRAEKKVYERLLNERFEAFCPTQKVKKRWSDRDVFIEEPIFKSYCFVRAFNDKLYTVREIVGVVNFVYWLGKPAIVRNDDIETIQNLFSKHLVKKVTALNIKEGDAIKIKAGPFYNQKAVVQKVYKHTIVVELKALNLKISLEKANIEI